MGPRGTRLQESGEDYTTRRFVLGTRNQYYSGDQIRKNEMGGACGTHGGQEKCIQGYCGKADGLRPRGRWDDNTKMDLWDGKARTGLIWLRLGTSGGFL